MTLYTAYVFICRVLVSVYACRPATVNTVLHFVHARDTIRFRNLSCMSKQNVEAVYTFT